jgi:hypothetical protein
MIEGKAVVFKVDFSCFMTSSGCSNMLSERLNSFLGRAVGFEFFLTCPLTGEPFRVLLESPANGCLGRGGTIMALTGARGRSCTGDSRKISDNVIDEDVVSLDTPLPNLKGGSRLSTEGFCGTQPVE